MPPTSPSALGQVEAVIADRQGGLFADFTHDVDFVLLLLGT